MKTPEEIKKGLETCIGECTGNKPHCPYHECGNGCMDTMNRNSLAYITQLENRLAQLERERNALMRDFKLCATRPMNVCYVCKNRKNPIRNMCEPCDAFEWRGVCEENSK